MKKSKKIFLTIALILLGLFIFLLIFGRAIPSGAKIKTSKLIQNYLQMNEDLFYRQTLNNCGPYSVMAVTNILRGENHDPEKLAKEMGWRIYKNLTFPQGVVDLLHKYKISTKEFVLSTKSENEKINFLKSQIDEEHPVILLIKIHHVLHYVTVLGYSENGFMLYDSMQEKNPDNQRKTVVDSECASGNRFYSTKELMDLWNDGGFKIFFKNWAVVCE